ILQELTGEEPTVVLSEDGPTANQGIEAFSRGTGKWLVAVRMVSEGVDVPRLAVGVYATKTRTEMFFRQAVGRFVREQKGETRRCGGVGRRRGGRAPRCVSGRRGAGSCGSRRVRSTPRWCSRLRCRGCRRWLRRSNRRSSTRSTWSVRSTSRDTGKAAYRE